MLSSHSSTSRSRRSPLVSTADRPRGRPLSVSRPLDRNVYPFDREDARRDRTQVSAGHPRMRRSPTTDSGTRWWSESPREMQRSILTRLRRTPHCRKIDARPETSLSPRSQKRDFSGDEEVTHAAPYREEFGGKNVVRISSPPSMPTTTVPVRPNGGLERQ